MCWCAVKNLHTPPNFLLFGFSITVWLFTSSFTQRVMPSSHRIHGQYKTVLSCRCRRCELEWRQVKTVGDRKFRNWTCLVFAVLFCLEMRDSTKPFSLKYMDRGLLKTVLTCRQFSSHYLHGQDKTVLSCSCRRCELGIIPQIDTVPRNDISRICTSWTWSCTTG